jgi:hypothetical protein
MKEILEIGKKLLIFSSKRKDLKMLLRFTEKEEILMLLWKFAKT